MPGKVFVSCGQRSEEEKGLVSDVKQCLKRLGFEPFVASETQSINDLNSYIIKNLKLADYYVFIDLRREKIGDQGYRGSLFSNQELAIAYVLDFENTFFMQQKGILREGMNQYILGNPQEFETLDEALQLLENRAKSWSTDYSRHLVADLRRYPKPIDYSDGTDYHQYVWHVELRNLRKDFPAFSTVARLDKIETSNGGITSPDLAFLKWAGQAAAVFENVIPPQRAATFDAFAIEASSRYGNAPGNVYLHSMADLRPRQPIITKPGNYKLHYQVLAQSFPLLEFCIALDHTGVATSSMASIEA